MNKIPEHYVFLPECVRRDDSLISGAKILYADIADICSKNGYCTRNACELAYMVNCNHQTIRTYLRQLLAKEYIVLDYSKNKINIKLNKYKIEKESYNG